MIKRLHDLKLRINSYSFNKYSLILISNTVAVEENNSSYYA